MELITFHNISSYRHHILASYLRHKNDPHSSSYFLASLNAKLRRELKQTGMVEAIYAREKDTDNLMIMAHIDGEKCLYMLNMREDKIRYLQGG